NKATRIDAELKQLLMKSSLNVGISEEMCVAYFNRYNQDFICFHNAIDSRQWLRVHKDYSIQGKPFEVAYIGSASYDKELQSLIDIRDAIIQLSTEGHNIRFSIYSNHHWKRNIETYLAHKDICRYGGLLDPQELVTTLTEASLLVLPINFDERSKRYVGLSMQTKVPEYMASGTATLVYAPYANPNARYAREIEWAAVVTQRDLPTLEAAISRLYTEAALRQNLGIRARLLAQENHDIKVVGERLRVALLSCSTSSDDAPIW
ncbi:MAG: hypothetical protein ACOCVG_05295, partial [Verrucomicrobiota bacterium]